MALSSSVVERSVIEIVYTYYYHMTLQTNSTCKAQNLKFQQILPFSASTNELLLVKLIGVNKGRHVTLKYFSILIRIDKEHRYFIVSGRSISFIYIVVK